MLKKGAVFVIRIDGFVFRSDFQILRVFYKEINETAFATNPGLERNFFFDPVVLADHHDQFQVPAGSESDISLQD